MSINISIDFDQKIFELDDTVMRQIVQELDKDCQVRLSDKGEMTLGVACASYLMRDTERLPRSEKIRRTRLARIAQRGGEHEVTPEQLALLRQCIEPAPALLLEQVLELTGGADE